MLGFKHMGWALALGLLVTLGGAAQAQAADVRLKVAVIHATKAAGQKDPALRKIQGALEKAFGGYTMFKQLAKHDLKLTRGQPEQVVLPNGRSADFTYQGPAGAHQHNIKFAVPDSKVDVDVRLPMNRMFYQAGFKHDGGILILALYLRPL